MCSVTAEINSIDSSTNSARTYQYALRTITI
jgi:hypothetical protein